MSDGAVGSEADPTPAPPGETVSAELAGNNFRILLIKAAGVGLVALISLSQLGSGARFGSGGPRFLLPVSVTTTVISAVFLGFAYANFAFESAALRVKLDFAGPTFLQSRVPSERVDGQSSPAERGRSGRKQQLLGLVVGAVAVVFYLMSVWWPASATAHSRRMMPITTTTTTCEDHIHFRHEHNRDHNSSVYGHGDAPVTT